MASEGILHNAGVKAALERLGREVAEAKPKDPPENMTDDDYAAMGLVAVGAAALQVLSPTVAVAMVDQMTAHTKAAHA